MKPKSWKELPGPVLESILWDIDLDYDSYESSKAEAVHELMCNPDCSHTNGMIVSAYWKALSDESFDWIVDNAIETLKRQLKVLTDYKKSVESES